MNQVDQAPHLIAVAGSPRRGGSSDHLLDAFLAGAKDAGANAARFVIADLNIGPCRGCDDCEKRGECVIDDDHPRLADRVQSAAILVVSSPVYFSGFPGMTKNFVDRFQAHWARRYRLNHPQSQGPVGYLLATGGAPSMKNFDGVQTTFKYLMQAIWGSVGGSLTVPNLDAVGAVTPGHSALDQAKELGYQSVIKHRERGST